MIDHAPPKYRRQKGNKGRADRAFVECRGRRLFLGKYNMPETRAAYRRLVAEWKASGGTLPVEPEQITVAEVIVRFVRRCRVHYRRPDGTPTSEIDNIKLAMRPVNALYGDALARDFGPRALKACRQWMIDGGGSRAYVNKHTNRLRLLFKWAVEEELVPPAVYQALAAVAGLKRGRCEARETEPVKPVPQADIDAVRPHVSRQVAALIDLQLYTGARAGELVTLRPVDLETTGEVWIARLDRHKTEHHGRDRLIYCGPKAQAVIQQFFTRPVDAFLFSPREAERERRDACPTHRHQPVKPSATERRIGDHYSTDSYRRAIHRACDDAGVDRWSPHRLRHNAATALRKRFGLEAAQLLLGHARADVTQLYAELNQAKAIEVARKVG